jgi:hypothetical protein
VEEKTEDEKEKKMEEEGEEKEEEEEGREEERGGLVISTKYEASHYTIFSCPCCFPLLGPNIFLSTLF